MYIKDIKGSSRYKSISKLLIFFIFLCRFSSIFLMIFATYKFSLWTWGYPMLRIRGYCLGQAGIETGRSFLNKVYRQAVIITDGNLQTERKRERQVVKEGSKKKERERERQHNLFYAKNNILKLTKTQHDTCSLCTVGAKWPQLAAAYVNTHTHHRATPQAYTYPPLPPWRVF